MKILIIENSFTAPAGVVGDALLEKGAETHTINILQNDESVPDEQLAAFDGLIVLGGPMGAFDDEHYPRIPEVLAIIRSFHTRKLPILGICLGAQQLARALGTPFRSNRGWEVGFTPLQLTDNGKRDPLFRDVTTEPVLYELHGDNFELPAGAELLMTGAGCQRQVFRVDDYSYGLQFHPEVTAEIIHSWAVLFGAEHPQEGEVTRRLTLDIDKYLPASKAFAHSLVNNWLALVRI